MPFISLNGIQMSNKYNLILNHIGNGYPLKVEPNSLKLSFLIKNLKLVENEGPKTIGKDIDKAHSGPNYISLTRKEIATINSLLLINPKGVLEYSKPRSSFYFLNNGNQMDLNKFFNLETKSNLFISYPENLSKICPSRLEIYKFQNSPSISDKKIANQILKPFKSNLSNIHYNNSIVSGDCNGDCSGNCKLDTKNSVYIKEPKSNDDTNCINCTDGTDNSFKDNIYNNKWIELLLWCKSVVLFLQEYDEYYIIQRFIDLFEKYYSTNPTKSSLKILKYLIPLVSMAYFGFDIQIVFYFLGKKLIKNANSIIILAILIIMIVIKLQNNSNDSRNSIDSIDSRDSSKSQDSNDNETNAFYLMDPMDSKEYC